MKPIRIEFKIGETRFQQPVKLILENRDGTDEWIIERGMANQQDNAESIHHLTKEMILKMAEAVKLTDDKYLWRKQ